MQLLTAPLPQEARNALHEAMKVLYCRDARSWPKYTLAIVNKHGAKLEGPIEFDVDWNIAEYVKGYSGIIG